MMDYDAIVTQALTLLQREQRLSYRVLKLRLQLDDDTLEALKEDLIYAKKLAVDEEGRVLVWTGETSSAPPPASSVPLPATPDVSLAQGEAALVVPSTPDAERRQLTVMFCDLVDSTRLASQLDPEDLREVVRAYQDTCAKVIARFDGHIAQYLGDGLLVYFGYPLAHEDDAQRAVRAGLGMIDALGQLNTRLEQERGVRLAVRLGIHTGLVVVGEIGSGGRQEQLALGETPNIAARLQSLAAPNTVVCSEATARLIHGYFVWQTLGAQDLKGLAQPLQVYQVLRESGAQTRLDIAAPRGLTPLVGREEEVALLVRRWAQARTGQGQVVLLSGEAGIGKSRLVQVLQDHVVREPHTRIEWRGSSYHQQSALYPVIMQLQRLLWWQEHETPEEKLRTLETILAAAGLPLPDIVPLLAALLSLPLPAPYPPLTLTPQRQRQQTLETLLAWLDAEARRQPVLLIVEDLHWIDPSTLELLSLLMDQGAQARLCLILTYRPEFHPPWAMAAHLTALVLSRFAPAQVERLARHVAGDKALPPAVLQEVVRKTDGVPLFIEELTKTVLESGLLQEQEDRYDLTGPLPPLAIPATLHDALMTRLDRLTAAKLVAQLGAVIGRTFAYELVQAVVPLDAATLQGALVQLVEAELVVQRGLPPQATYMFKHALVQETAYQSLLRSTRQQYHQRIAQVLEAQFPESVTTQPELLARHYTAAGLTAQALHYWQQAGQHALQRSAYLEAIQHLTTGLALLATLSETPARAQQELDMQLALGSALIATKGHAAPETGQAFDRARALCAHVGETPQRFRALRGLCGFYRFRGALRTAQELGEQLVQLVEGATDPMPRLEAHEALGGVLSYLGEYAAAWTHLEQGIPLIDPVALRALALRHGTTSGVGCLGQAAFTLWCLGFPAQALRRSQEALALAQALAHPLSLALAQYLAALLYHRRHEVLAVQAQAETLLALATQHGFPNFVGFGTCWQGWVLAMHGQGAAGLAQLHQGMAVALATGQELSRPLCLMLRAEAAGHVGQIVEGLGLLAEVRTALEASERGDLLAEAYRLQGELLQRQDVPDVAQAEVCFQQALAIARRQQAKSWELRAATSLARLWQRQGKRTEARARLAPIYGWFTEGFDTADLQDAKTLLDALA
jgi:class 3 adenylate cyclase/predicted ATPase